jgi:hypothetical protein
MWGLEQPGVPPSPRAGRSAAWVAAGEEEQRSAGRRREEVDGQIDAEGKGMRRSCSWAAAKTKCANAATVR